MGGIVKDGSGLNTIFTLPVGYRPDFTDVTNVAQVFVCSSNSLFGSIAIIFDGQVQLIVGSTAWATLDGISFRAAQI